MSTKVSRPVLPVVGPGCLVNNHRAGEILRREPVSWASLLGRRALRGGRKSHSRGNNELRATYAFPFVGVEGTAMVTTFTIVFVRSRSFSRSSRACTTNPQANAGAWSDVMIRRT